MIKLVLRLVIYAAAILAITRVVPGIAVSSFTVAFIVAATISALSFRNLITLTKCQFIIVRKSDEGKS